MSLKPQIVAPAVLPEWLARAHPAARLDAAAVAGLFGVHVSSVYKWTRDGAFALPVCAAGFVAKPGPMEWTAKGIIQFINDMKNNE